MGMNSPYQVLIDLWAGYWHTKYFYTGNKHYWLLGSLPALQGWSVWE